MLKSNQIIGIGVGFLAISLLVSHSIGLSYEFTSFLSGLGCSLTLVGAGRRFVEMR